MIGRRIYQNLWQENVFLNCRAFLNLSSKGKRISGLNGHRFTAGRSRAILKEKKPYIYNYPRISDSAARFENMAALELLRAVTQWNEHGWGNFSLCGTPDRFCWWKRS